MPSKSVPVEIALSDHTTIEADSTISQVHREQIKEQAPQQIVL